MQFFFFNDTATTEIYTLSLHDALPIYDLALGVADLGQHGLEPLLELTAVLGAGEHGGQVQRDEPSALERDRKSTRLNSSHANISYAVFCLQREKTTTSYSLATIQLRMT